MAGRKDIPSVRAISLFCLISSIQLPVGNAIPYLLSAVVVDDDDDGDAVRGDDGIDGRG